MKKYSKLILKIIVSITLLTIIFLKIDKQEFLNNFSLLNFKFLPLLVGLLFINYVVSSIRWKALLIHNNSKNVSIKYLIGLYFTGAFFNNFMPTSIGGDVYKVYKLGKKIGSTVDAFSATFMERFTGVIALVLISVVSLIKYLGLLGILLLIGFFIGTFIGFYALSFMSHKSDKIKKIYDSLISYKGQYKVLGVAFLTSFIVQFASIFTQYFVFRALGVNLPLLYSMSVFPLIILASFFIPSLNGVGVQDTLFMKFFTVVGVQDSLSLSASIIFHLLKLLVSLIGGVIYAIDKES